MREWAYMGMLSIVATPIGNLEDITLRALRVLKESDVVFAEDTRVTAKLFARYEIKTPLKRLDAKFESKRAEEIVTLLNEGNRIAYVSDAGTPGISDPGPRLVSYVRTHAPSAKIEAIAGPSALAAAISVTGVQFDSFLFLGFLPHKKGRLTALKYIAQEPRAMVLFESPHRIERLLTELSTHISVRSITVLKELTKIHENVMTGTSQTVLAGLKQKNALKGEFVVVIHAID